MSHERLRSELCKKNHEIFQDCRFNLIWGTNVEKLLQLLKSLTSFFLHSHYKGSNSFACAKGFSVSNLESMKDDCTSVGLISVMGSKAGIVGEES